MTEVLARKVNLRGAALAAMSCRDPEVLLAGPAGTGKSYAAIFKIHMMMLANPGARALMVRKTHVSLTQTGLVTYREQVLPEALSAGLVHWYGGSGEKPAGYVYQNGSKPGRGSFVAVGGMDQAAKIMSSEYDVVYVQEATDLTMDDWEKITSRLRNGKIRFQQLLADCNPQQPSHWLKKRCDAGATTMLYSRHEDNPRIVDEAGHVTEYGASYLAKLDALTGVRKERLRWGRWAAADGIIYADWRPEIHLVDTPEGGLPRSWPRIWGIDFGYTNPFVWQMWAIDPDGRLWLEKEIYRSQRLVEDHARDILNVVAPGGVWRYPKPKAIVVDHDAEDRATLERHLGMPTVNAIKNVSEGIQAVQVRLRVQENGRPRMLICRDALIERDEALAEAGKPLGFAQEVEGYVWKPAPNAALGREKATPDEPEKLNDHSCDTARYVVAYEDLQPKLRVRFL